MRQIAVNELTRFVGSSIKSVNEIFAAVFVYQVSRRWQDDLFFWIGNDSH